MPCPMPQTTQSAILESLIGYKSAPASPINDAAVSGPTVAVRMSPARRVVMSDIPDKTPGYAMCAEMSVSEMLSHDRPRFVLVTQRAWMNAYCSLDAGELSFRLGGIRAETEGFDLWLWCLALYRAAMSHTYTLTDDRIDEQTHGPIYRSEEFRLNILGLAGGNVKLAMDAALAGYYNGCLALERHMLETWRRSAYARLHNLDIWRWFPTNVWPEGMIPAQSRKKKPADGEMPTWPPEATEIAAIVNAHGDEFDKRFLQKVKRGFGFLNAHVHPTLEGASQMWRDGNPYQHVFGPTFDDRLCAWSVHWGLFAGVILLWEVARLKFQGDVWVAELGELSNAIARWGLSHSEHLAGDPASDDEDTSPEETNS